ncbi:MAG TPA: CoA pyrophosphatase [Solirubrobacteraceae bacterium]|nr:CoA pyrophosphatase [Solirubrobacteraceae bacterium]
MSAFTWPPELPASASAAASAEADQPGPGAGAPSPASPPEGEGEQIPAAVLVALFIAGDPAEPHVVLTRRRADLRRHAGEISFPGGRRDAEDADLMITALREAEEEIGLPRTQVSMLGELPATSTLATRYTIHPFVGQIPAGVAWRLSAREVDAVLELPLSEVRAGARKVAIERRGITFQVDAYVVAEHVIWGATARILAHLFERLAPAADSDGRLALA